MFRNKGLIIGVIFTLLLIGGGVFLFSKGGSPLSGTKISETVLAPEDEAKTSGISKGSYLPPSESATVTIVEFGDYQCPACGAYQTLVKQLLGEFAGKINYVFRDFPLKQHANALVSSYAAESAGLQGKFWQMHEKLYESQGQWSTSQDAKSIFIGYAKDLGLDTAKFAADMDSKEIKDKIQRDESDGNLVGINQTPTFFINGVKISNLPASYDEFKKLVEKALSDSPLPSGSPSGAYHAHFDLKVYINGAKQNFTAAKYSESKANPLNENIHFHDQNGDIVHVHKTGIALSELFGSIKFSFAADSATSGLKVYVNGKLSPQALSYIPQDTDQILVSYGPVNDGSIASQIASVTNNSCIYSLKCPERGTPPPEDCVGGLGTGCTD